MEQEVNSMSSLVVTKDQLLKVLEENKQTHVELFEAAKSGYEVAVVQELAQKELDFKSEILRFRKSFAKFKEEAQESIDAGEDLLYPKTKFVLGFSKFSPSFETKCPTNFEDQYDAAIKKVEMSAYSSIRLSNEEFMQYVMNDWEWKDNFKDTCTRNISFASGSYSPDKFGDVLSKLSSY